MTDRETLIKERPIISIAVLDDLENGWCDSDHPAIAKLVQWYKDTAPGAQTLSAPGDAERAVKDLLGEYATAHVELLQRLEREMKELLRRPVAPVVTHYGYLYFNPDTGIEWAPNHPIESGEVPDAQDVRPAGLKELHAEMEAAWHLLHEEREGHKQPLTKQDEDLLEEAWVQHKAALNVSQPGVK